MIRDGIKEDAEKIAKIKIDNWRKTYSKIFPEDFLNNLDVTKEKEKYLNNLKNKNIIIYEKEEKPIAYCYYGKSENTKFKDYEGEVFALYVENNCQEHGVGTKLLQYAIKDLAKKSKKIFLWCAKENTRAISFYKKNGFKIIGGTCKDFFKPYYNSLRNFHGMWFYDSDVLDKMFDYQHQDTREYWKEVKKTHKIL